MQIMHNSISQTLVESLAGAAAANCLRELGEDANSEDAFSGRAGKRVAELRARTSTLVPEVTESIRFIYTAAFQLDATGLTNSTVTPVTPTGQQKKEAAPPIAVGTDGATDARWE